MRKEMEKFLNVRSITAKATESRDADFIDMGENTCVEGVNAR